MADDFFSEIGRSLSRFTQQAVGKTGEVVEMTKFNAQISSEQKEVETKRKPTYVFIHMIMNDESWHAVRNVTGVTGFVGPGSRPVPLTDAELKKLNIGSTVAEFAFKVGDTISVVSGAFAGYTGVLQEISEDQKQLTVLVSAGRRDISVMIDTQDARLAE